MKVLYGAQVLSYVMPANIVNINPEYAQAEGISPLLQLQWANAVWFIYYNQTTDWIQAQGWLECNLRDCIYRDLSRIN